MSADFIRNRAGGSSPDPQPFLDALGRLQERAVLTPEELTQRAGTLLNERLGMSSAAVEAAFAHGGAGLQADHTHYFEGFALLKTLSRGTAVAVRKRDAGPSCIVLEGVEDVWACGDGDEAAPAWIDTLRGVMRHLVPPDTSVELAVAASLPGICADPFLAALGVSAARALQALFALPDSTDYLLRRVRSATVEATGAPFSMAYLIASDAGRPGAYTLVDTFTLERMSLDARATVKEGWGLVNVGDVANHTSEFDRTRAEETSETLAALRKKAFPELESLRDLEHRDLEVAVQAVPRRLRPLLRHLVMQNRRVQKLVAALRGNDWQMFGALMLMSHASSRNDWRSTHERADFVVEQAEQMTLEGIYGAASSGRSGCVLVLGQPFTVPRALDRIAAAYEEEYGERPGTLLL